MITATATYRAYNTNAKEQEHDFPLTLLPAAKDVGGAKYLGPVYTSNFNDIRAEALQNYKDQSKPKTIKKTITLYYAVDSDEIEASQHVNQFTKRGQTYTASKTAKAKVLWQLPTN